MSDISKASNEVTQKPKQHFGTVVRVKINEQFGLLQLDGSDTLAQFRIKDVPKMEVDGVMKMHIKVGQRYAFDAQPNDAVQTPDNRRYITHEGKVIELKVVGKMVPTTKPAPVAANQSNPDVEIGGTVKWFNNLKGYGFVVPDDGGKDVFVHIEQNARRNLVEGDKLVFDRVQGVRKAGQWSVSVIHTVNGQTVTGAAVEEAQKAKIVIPDNIPENEIQTLKLEVREYEDGLRLALPAPYTLFSIPLNMRADAGIFASYPEYHISSTEPLEAGETLSMRVWVSKDGEVMLLPKDYKGVTAPQVRYQDAVAPEGVTAARGNRPFVVETRAARPRRVRTPGRGGPQGNEGQK